MMCIVNLIATLEEQSIHIEKYEDENSLVFAVEGEEPALEAARLAWRYMRRHPERPARMVRLWVQGPLPPRRLHQVQRAWIWLACKIARARIRHPPS